MRTLTLLGGLLAAAAVAAQAEPAPASLQQRIDAHVAAPRFGAASWSIQVVSIDSGRTLYERDANRLLVPASTAKLYTGALALETFGADYRVSTRLLATARPARDGTLHGDLILQGRGDPTLGTEASPDWAGRLADGLRKAGVRRIDGDLVADATYFPRRATAAAGKRRTCRAGSACRRRRCRSARTSRACT